MSGQRYYIIDYFKCYAIFFVVCGHAFPFSEISKPVYFFIDNFPKIAVAYFFVISGFLFGSKTLNGDADRYFIKYIKKIASLYFGWTFFYFMYEGAVSYFHHTGFHPELAELSGFKPVASLIADIIYYGYSGKHLWFLISLIWSISILFLFVKYNRLKALLIISFILNFIGLFGSSYYGIYDLTIETRNAVFYGLFYCTLGCWFSYHESQIRQKGYKLSTLMLLSLFFIAVQTVERLILIKYYSGDILDNIFISTIPLTICLFLITMLRPEFGANSYFTQIGKKSLGIYVIHLVVIDFITYTLIKEFNFNSKTIIYQLLFTPLVFFASYYTYEILQLFKLRMIRVSEHFLEEKFYQKLLSIIK